MLNHHGGGKCIEGVDMGNMKARVMGDGMEAGGDNLQ